jgi:hypothetical protein
MVHSMRTFSDTCQNVSVVRFVRSRVFEELDQKLIINFLLLDCRCLIVPPVKKKCGNSKHTHRQFFLMIMYIFLTYCAAAILMGSRYLEQKSMFFLSFSQFPIFDFQRWERG